MGSGSWTASAVEELAQWNALLVKDGVLECNL
jgi:hypothetical protein